MRKLSKLLLNKSQESFLLALELFNKPTVGYRVESFCVLFSNAWELLLKAYILESNNGKKNSIYYKKEKNKTRKTVTLDYCLKKIFKDNDPIRKNIEYISELRNEAAHLIISELEPYFSRVFQSGVINYIELVNEKFDIDLVKILSPGFISLVSQERDIRDIRLLKRKLSKDDLQSVKTWLNRFNELEKLGHKATIPLEYKVVITNNIQKADAVLATGGHRRGLTQALIIEKSRDVDQTHPYLFKEALAEVNRLLTIQQKLTSYDLQAYCYCNKIKKTNKNQYFWHARSASPRYSQKFVQEMAEFYNTHSDQYSETRRKYKNRK